MTRIRYCDFSSSRFLLWVDPEQIPRRITAVDLKAAARIGLKLDLVSLVFPPLPPVQPDRFPMQKSDVHNLLLDDLYTTFTRRHEPRGLISSARLKKRGCDVGDSETGHDPLDDLCVHRCP